LGGRVLAGARGTLADVADAISADRRPLVGRAGEVAEIVGLAHQAAGGRAGALLVSGEAGVGKTALLREACSQVSEVADLLWAACLPLTSLAVPFLPLKSALREWSQARDIPVPAFVGPNRTEPGDMPEVFDAWLSATCRRRPLLFVVDDLHWADQSSLDVLMYVLAGPADRRLAVVTTTRTSELGEGHPLRRWLADVRRLPGVSELQLGALDRAATAEQIAGLLGGPAHTTLVDAVFARSRGNAYLTTLLVRGLPPDATTLPPHLPTDLEDAVARAWRGLSVPCRQLTALIAVGGRPRQANQLGEVAATVGVTGELTPMLREAVDAGVLAVGADQSYWFVHPLLAEVLEGSLLPEQRRAWHAAFAATLEPVLGLNEMRIDDVVALADHHHRAGHPAQAYRWALRGAEAAERVGGAAEMLRLLRRALQLWGDVPDADVTRLDLLQRIRVAAERAGEQQEELAAVDQLLTLVDREHHALLVAELLVRRMQLRLSTGREFAGLDDVRDAVRVSSAYPPSWQYAFAMAELAHAELWHAVPSGRADAEQAVRLARACGSAKALSYALTAHVMARCLVNDTSGLADAYEAQTAAAEARDFWAFVHATLWAGNCLDVFTSRTVTEYWGQSRQRMVSLRAPHCYVALLSANEAAGLLLNGQWRACLERLRVALGSTPGPMADVLARLTAALLSCWQGRQAEAQTHLTRAEEIFAEQSAFLAFEFDAVRAELAVANRDTERAVQCALQGAALQPPPTMCERLLPLAARALADAVQPTRDRGDDPSALLSRLVELQQQFPQVISDPGPGPVYDAQLRGMQAWYEAELLRAQADPRAAHTWRRAAEALAAGQLPWDEAYAWWRTAEAALHDRETGGLAVTALRHAHQLAVELEAVPLRTELQALARSARISLTTPEAVPIQSAAALPTLTSREREILSYVIAGSTYAEIARDLVISEKTVSAHVSNLLRKTGTTNRIQLAQLARRLVGTIPD
jgi:DNA-binding CsgD family transcriptional regulator